MDRHRKMALAKEAANRFRIRPLLGKYEVQDGMLIRGRYDTRMEAQIRVAQLSRELIEANV